MATEFSAWVWEVINDPTSDAHWAGDFLHRRFRQVDLHFSAVNGGWPEGITFRHIKRGSLLRYSDGRLSPYAAGGVR
jgi:hypothetical protein